MADGLIEPDWRMHATAEHTSGNSAIKSIGFVYNVFRKKGTQNTKIAKMHDCFSIDRPDH